MLYVLLSDNLYQMASQLECVTWNQMNSLASSMKRWDFVAFYFQHHMVQFLIFTGALFMCSLSLLMHVLNAELSIWRFSGLGYYKVIQTFKKEEKRRKQKEGAICAKECETKLSLLKKFKKSLRWSLCRIPSPKFTSWVRKYIFRALDILLEAGMFKGCLEEKRRKAFVQVGNHSGNMAFMS